MADREREVHVTHGDSGSGLIAGIIIAVLIIGLAIVFFGGFGSNGDVTVIETPAVEAPTGGGASPD